MSNSRAWTRKFNDTNARLRAALKAGGVTTKAKRRAAIERASRPDQTEARRG